MLAILAERVMDADQGRKEMAAVKRKLTNLIEAIADGLRSPGLQARLSALEAERDRLTHSITASRPNSVRLMPNLGEAYRRQVGRLREALAAGDDPEAISTALIPRFSAVC